MTSRPDTKPAPPLKRAAKYVRMSTDHQEYSTLNQTEVIEQYARAHGYTIVRTYSDEGRSGLNVSGRPALQQLIADVQSGQSDFEAILAYDVSRWGRFQDSDESAYYEYLCKRAGIEIQYCAEQFVNDGGPTAAIVKSVKRAMAAEYSRELSAKVFQGQSRIIELGFRRGGQAGYGLRRALVDREGNFKTQLEFGEWKSVQTDRVILVPGPEAELRVVRRIYQLFVRDHLRYTEIARLLNAEGLRAQRGAPWTKDVVRAVLTNEKYIGNNVFNVRSCKLQKKQVRNPPEAWIRKDRAFAPVVDPELFAAAQELIPSRRAHYTDQEMIDRLRELVREHGKLTGDLIDAADRCPTSHSYINRFGTLRAAYALAGYVPRQRYNFVFTDRRLLEVRQRVADDLSGQLEAAGAEVRRDGQSSYLVINRQLSVIVVPLRYRATSHGAPRWLVRLDAERAADAVVLVRMDAANETPVDYYVLPGPVARGFPRQLADTNGAEVDAFRFPNLRCFVQLTRRQPLESSQCLPPEDARCDGCRSPQSKSSILAPACTRRTASWRLASPALG